MKLTLLTGPASSAKTERVLGAFRRCRLECGSGKALLVVPEQERGDQLTRLLLEQSDTTGLLGRPVVTFFELSREILQRARQAPTAISETERLLLLREISAGLDLGYFQRAKQFPGFAEALGEIIEELKLAMIHPDDFDQATKRMGRRLGADFTAKSGELAQLYQRYQHEVLAKQGLLDTVGLMWQAASLLEHDPHLLGDLKYLILDGFPKFTEIQKRLFHALAQRVSRIIITLDYEPERAVLYETMGRTRDWLISQYAVEEESVPPEQAAGALARLERGIFTVQDPAPGDVSVTILEGASPAVEIEMIARTIRRLMREQGRKTADFAVIAREAGSYSTRVASTFARYGLPVASPERPVDQSGLGRMLLSCLTIIAEDWPREAVMEALRSGYLTGDHLAVAEADLRSRQLGKRNGRATWLEQWPDDQTQTLRREALSPIVDFEQKVTSAKQAQEIADAVTALVRAFRWGELDDERWREDMRAYQQISDGLTAIVNTEQRIGRPIVWPEFRELFELMMRSTTYRPRAERVEEIALVSAGTIAGRRWPIVFVCGLLEKVFPRQVRENAFLRDRERNRLREVGLTALADKLPEQDHERHYFHSAIAAAKEQLFLTYPAADEAAKDSLPSFYLDEVRKLFAEGSLPHLKLDVSDFPTDPAEEASHRQPETAAELGDGLTWAIAAETDKAKWPRIAAIYNRSLEGNGERLLFPFRSPDPLLAVITDSHALAQLATGDQFYSPTALEAFANCPFKHFCSRLLRVEEIREQPEALEMGSIIHEILQRWYEDWHKRRGDSLDLTKESREELIATCLALIDPVMAEESLLGNMRAHEVELMRRELRAVLTRFVLREIEVAGERDFVPTRFELRFGRRPRPLIITGAGGRVIKISGYIDRVDVERGGSGALVIDYKRGRIPDMREHAHGLVLQAPLYALAVRQLHKLEPVGVEYYSVQTGDRRGFTTRPIAKTKPFVKGAKEQDTLTPVLEQTEQRVPELVARIEAGEVRAAPLNCDYCAYDVVCRIPSWKKADLRAPITEEPTETTGEAD